MTFFHQNIKAFASIYPDSARLIQQSTPTDPPSLQLSTDELTNQWNPQTEIHLVDNFASCGYVRALFNRINLAELASQKNRRLLLIDSRPNHVAQAFTSRDWTTLITSPLCLFTVTTDQTNILAMLLKKYPHIANGSLTIYTYSDTQPDRTETIRQAFAQTRDTVTTAIQQAKPQPKPPYPKSIRFFVPGHNYLQNASVLALQNLGYEAQRLQWKNPLYAFVKKSAWIHELQSKPIDTAVYLNATSYTLTQDTPLSKWPINHTAWFVDNPLRYCNQPRDYAGCTSAAVFDKTYIPYISEHTRISVKEVRTGFGIDPSKAIPRDEFSNIDLAFVGELGAQSTTTLEHGFRQINPIWIETSSQIIHDHDLIKPLFITPIAQDSFKANGIRYQGSLVEYLENKATWFRRRKILESIADKDLAVFGDNEWGNPTYSGALASCYAGRRLSYVDDLPSLYASAKINLNIFHVQCVSAPNPRVYDVLAAGGFLLTTYNSGLEDEFVIGQDLIVFHSMQELRELIDYYLHHPQEREQIAQQGKARALANMAYSDRMQTLLSGLSDQ